MATIYPTKTRDEGGGETILWLAESAGKVVASGATATEAATNAAARLQGCADLARWHNLPSKYARRLESEAEVFRVQSCAGAQSDTTE